MQIENIFYGAIEYLDKTLGSHLKMIVVGNLLCFLLNTQGKGVPDERMERNNHTYHLPSNDILPTQEEAVTMYERDGGNISQPEVFGFDPLLGQLDKQKARLYHFNSKFPNLDVIFHTLVNGDNHLFEEALLSFINLTLSMDKV